MQSVGATFRRDWERSIDVLTGVSAGVVRSLKAFAEADVSETLATISDAGDLGPGRAAGVLQAWHAWHLTYVHGQIARMLPELCERWPTKAERAKANARRQKRQRWVRDASRVVEAATVYYVGIGALQGKLELRPRRLAALVSKLEEIGAVRVRNDGAVLALASPQWVGEKMHALVSYI